MLVRRLALLAAGLGLATLILWGAGLVVAVRELDAPTPPSGGLARAWRRAEPWSFVDEALARPRVVTALGAGVEVVGWDEVVAGPGRLAVVARVRGRARDGAQRDGRLRVVAQYYWGPTVDDTAWGWQYPEVELETGDGAWSFAPPTALMSDPEGPRRW